MARRINLIVIYIVIWFSMGEKIIAQDSTSLGGYLETYYAYRFNQPDSEKTIPLLYNYNRHNEFALNLGLVNFHRQSEKSRMNFGVMGGTYCQANYSSEPLIFRHIYNANAGFSVIKNVWFDAGIFGTSHIGFENAISTENWTLTRSLGSEYTPYFESGAKVTYVPQKWNFSIMILNGWQNIESKKGAGKALGSQITWQPSDSLTLNYSTFVGNIMTTSGAELRWFQDFYVLWEATRRLAFAGGTDFGMQFSNKYANMGKYRTWYSAAVQVRMMLSKDLYGCFRIEEFSDPDKVMIITPFQHGLNAAGVSINFEYLVDTHIKIRIEGRNISSEHPFFPGKNGYSGESNTLTTSFIYYFQ